MMKIVVNNIDRLLRIELSKICEIVEINAKPNGVFIQWVDAGNEISFLRQTKIIGECIDCGIPLIIFDKYQKMTTEEIGFLIKPGIFLWEPALCDRMFFSYQPVWGKFPTNINEYPMFDSNRKLELGYNSDLKQKIPTFEKYYKPINDIGEHKVAFVDHFNNYVVNQRVSDIGVDIISDKQKLLDIKTIVLLGTERDYNVGYLDPNIFEYLENGVVPLLPCEHRWYYGVFRELVVRNDYDINFFLKTYNNIAYGLVYGVYENLMENLPEANVINVAKRITSFFK